MSEKACVVFVDIDDTLIRTVGRKRIPLPHVVAKVRDLAAEDTVLFAWSSGGAECARDVVSELGIAPHFNGFLPKPNLMLDDQTPSEWRYLKVMHPNELL